MNILGIVRNTYFSRFGKGSWFWEGYCQLYDYKSLLFYSYENQQTEASKRMGLKLDNKIFYQEDIGGR